MTSRFTELCIDCHDHRRLAEFWRDVLDWRITENADEPYTELVDPEGTAPCLIFAPVPERKSVKNRLHIDVNPRDRDQGEEVQRLLDLGASRVDVGQGTDVGWVVLADPEGNEFCVLGTRMP